MGASTDLEVAQISGFHRMLVRTALAAGFLSGLNLVLPVGGYFTHALMAAVFVPLLLARKNAFPPILLVVFYGLALWSVVTVVATGHIVGDVPDRILASLASLTLAVFILAVYYAAFVVSDRSAAKFFYEYLRVALFFAWLGVAQQIIFVAAGTNVFGFLPTGAKNYGSFLGISGLSVEPAFYACALLPAACYHVVKFVTEWRMSGAAVITVGAVVFSTSAVGYLGLLVAAVVGILVGTRPSRRWLVIVSLPVIFFAGQWMLQQDFIQLRLRDSLFLLQVGSAGGFGANISSYSLAVNVEMTQRFLSEGFGFGAGFGRYSVVYDQYIGSFAVPSYRDTLPGRGSATSFLLRVTAELGIVGIALMLATVRAFVRAIRRGVDDQIAIAGLAAFVVILLRMGEYFDNGVIFVILLGFLMQRESARPEASPAEGATKPQRAR